MTVNIPEMAMTGQTLQGKRGWVITDGKAGMVVQVRGVADALGLDYTLKEVVPTGLSRILAPWGPVPGGDRFGQSGSHFAPPWPDVAIATGRASIPYLRALKRHAGPQCFTVVLQDPKTGRDTADLIWVPQHDRRRGANVITTLTSPHYISPEILKAERAQIPDPIAALPAPRVAVVLGGKNAVYKFREEDDARLEVGLASIASLGASFMITTSRRTHQRLFDAVDRATNSAPRIVWTGDGENPYMQFLAHADWLVVTADSVNMTGEACSTGRPVFVFAPSGGSAKFDRFHAALQAYGATRPLPERVVELEAWTYAPLNSAQFIADEIVQRWRKSCEDVPRKMSP